MAFTNEDVQEIKEIVLETIAEESDPIEDVQQVSELSDGDEVPIVRSSQGVNSYGRAPVNLFGGGGGEPSQYLKEASVSQDGNTLTLTKKNNSTVTFTPNTGGGVEQIQSDWNQANTSAKDFIKNKPTSMPANGGDAATVNNHSVEKDVPSDAVFTDHTYSVMGASGSTHASGLVPDTPTTAGTSKFLREDGEWATPPSGGGGNTADVNYDTTNKKITKTIDGTTSDVVTVATLKTDMNLAKGDVELGNVVNTGDSATPVSGGTTKFTTGGAYTELAKKVDKVVGKGLSTNDYTDAEKSKLAGITAGAEVNVQSDWNATSGDAAILNKPTIPAAVAVKGDAETSYRTGNVNITPANIGLGNVGNFKAVSTVASQGLSDTEKSNARTNIGAGTSNFSGDYDDLTNKPTVLKENDISLNYYHQYGNFFGDIENMYLGGINLNWAQSLVVTEDYFYLFFTRAEYMTIGSTSNVRRDHAVCLLYDRKFNFKGYSEITYSDSTLYNTGVCHANDATLCNGDIYLAICDDYAKGVLKVSASTLASNCQSSSHPNTTAVKVLSNTAVIAIDYDSASNTFAINLGNSLAIYDSGLNFVKTVKDGYMQVVCSAINGVITQQGLIIRDGIIECYDWYHYLGNDDSGGCVVLSSFDIDTGLLKDVRYVLTDFTNEIEGACKDPVTGSVWSVFGINAYNTPEAFSVGYFGTRRVKEDVNVKQLRNVGLLSSNSGLAVYVKNDYTGYSNGSLTMPYKTVGEAIVSIVGYITRIELVLFYTGQDYYCNYIRTSDFPIRITSTGSSRPTLRTTIRTRYASITVANVNLTGSSFSNESSVILLEQDSYLWLENCDISLDDTHKNAIKTKSVARMTVSNSTFTASSGDADLINRTATYCAVWRQYGSLYVSVTGSVTCKNLAFVYASTNDGLINIEGWNALAPMLTLTNSLFAINNTQCGPIIHLPDANSSSEFNIYSALAEKTGNNPAFRFTVRKSIYDIPMGEYYNIQGVLKSGEKERIPSIASGSGTLLASGTDLNSIVNSGTYFCPSGGVAKTILNTPYSTGNFRLWHIINTGDDGNGSQQWSTQILLNPSGGRMWMRGHEGSAFGAWTEFYTVKALSGDLASRPTGVAVGYQYFDTSLATPRPIFYKGDGKWVDATGIEV